MDSAISTARETGDFTKKQKSGKMLLIKKVTKDNARIVETRIGMLKV